MIAPRITSGPSNAFSALRVAICVLAILAIPGMTTAAASSNGSPELSLTFPTKQAQLSGSRVSVWSTCQGPEARVCHGDLTLTTRGNKQSAQFSVIAGTNQSLTVPLQIDSSANRVVAIVKTAQADGSFARSRAVLHLR